MSTRILVIGSGGREHALVWALARAASTGAVDAAPGNPGTARLGTNHPVGVGDREGLLALARDYDLVVVGPEVPLVEGLADALRADGVAVFGPGADGARLEGSKAFAKEFMARHGVPTARHVTVRTRAEADAVLAEWGAPIVVKASGLAAGKGVTVAETRAEAEAALGAALSGAAFGEAGETVVLEERMTGEEVSLFVITDGTRFTLLPAAQDHKRAFDGDRGPNTGGMGAYAPTPLFDDDLRDTVVRTIVEPTLAGLRADGIDYRGLLYVGLMLTPDGPKVVEYNVRFGDPETQAVLPLVDGDLATWLLGAARGRLDAPRIAPFHGAAAVVGAATRDYPTSSEKGLPIAGVEEAEGTGVLVFHAGTALDPVGRLVTAGGRVLGAVGRADDLPAALRNAYAGVERLEFDGVRHRTDIGRRALRAPSHG